MKKRPMTLLEIMVVIFLIGIILGVISYNMKGSIDKGRAFKTRQAKSQIEDILCLELANKSNDDSDTLDKKNVVSLLKRSGLIKNPEKLVLDGWNNLMEFSRDDDGNIVVKSEALDAYDLKMGNNDDDEPIKE